MSRDEIASLFATARKLPSYYANLKHVEGTPVVTAAQQFLDALALLEKYIEGLEQERARKAAEEARGAYLASTRTRLYVDANESNADIIERLCDELDLLQNKAVSEDKS